MSLDIEALCKAAFADGECVMECNWLVWRVTSQFCRKSRFGKTKDSVSADGMVGIMEGGRGWKKVAGADAGEIVDHAIELAGAGNLVVAGMTSAQLGDAHGHVAIVIGGPGEYSARAGRVLPFAYAGSRQLSARIPSGAKKHLGWTFPSARWKEIGYWYRAPDALRKARRKRALNTRR